MATRGLVLLAKDTFSGVSSVAFDNVFSNTYKQYKIIFNLTATASGNGNMVLRASGSDETNNYYNYQDTNGDGTSLASARTTSTSNWIVLQTNTVEQCQFFELLNPFQTTYTSGINQTPYLANGNIRIYLRAYGTNVTNSYDGFKYNAQAASTVSGSISVYGLAE